MKRTLALVSLLGGLLLVAAPASGAEQFILTCHVCTDIDVIGKGLSPNSPYTVIIRDVATGQEVAGTPMTVTTNASGGFSKSIPLSLREHPALTGSIYDASGATVVLAAHSRFTAPVECGRATSLPFTGAATVPLLAVGLSMLALGGTLLARSRRSG